MYQERQIWVVLMECQLHVMMKDILFSFHHQGHRLNADLDQYLPQLFSKKDSH